jgi:hypothetical protein
MRKERVSGLGKENRPAASSETIDANMHLKAASAILGDRARLVLRHHRVIRYAVRGDRRIEKRRTYEHDNDL